ncbi:hypothetical protein OEG92_09785 [Polaribacter sejongensis]|uniref:hypothetical protein n=1 Tax=Polaribacter sejongensis TaxID=985043 RepID=UPI0035A73A3A
MKGGDAIIIEAKTVVAKKADVTTMVTATGTIEPITKVEVGTRGFWSCRKNLCRL